MTFSPAQQRLLITAVCFSTVTSLIACAAAFSALRASRQHEYVMTNTEAPVPLTSSNPASALPHAASVAYISGSIASVASGTITLVVTAGPNTVHLTSQTKLYDKGARKDPAQFQKEMQQFLETLKSAGNTDQIFFAPNAFETTPIAVTDLKAGDRIQVRTDASDQQNALVIYREAKQ